VALATCYAVLGKLGLQLDAVGGFATLVWPPTGLALVALLIGGLGLWPGVAIGALAVNLWTGATLPVAAGIAVGNTGEAVAGAYLLVRFARLDRSLGRLRDVLALVLAALLTTPLSASIGVGSLLLGAVVPPASFAATWRAWWLGDLMGDLVVAPFLLVWIAGPALPRVDEKRRWSRAEAIVLGLAAALVACSIFSPWGRSQSSREIYLLFPLLIAAALRFGQRGATAMTLFVSAAAIAGTALGQGPFVQATLTQSLFPLQSFMAVLAITALLLAATGVERDLALAQQELSKRRASFIAQAGQVLGESLSYKLIMEKLARLAVPTVADWCTIVVLDERDQLQRVAVIHKDPAKRELADEYRRSFPPQQHRSTAVGIMRSGKAALTPVVTHADLEASAQSPEHLRLMEQLGVASTIIAPMVVRERFQGVISLMRSEPGHSYGPADLDVAERLAFRAALAVENARLFEELRFEEQRRRFLAEAGLRLAESLDYQKTLALVAQMTVPQLADFCTVDLLDEAGELDRVAVAHVDPEKVELVRRLSTRPGSGAMAGVAQTIRAGQSLRVPEVDVELFKDLFPDPAELSTMRQLGLRSAMIVPMRARGQILGALSLSSTHEGFRYSERDLAFAEELAARAGMAVDSARLYHQAQAAVAEREEVMAAVSHDLKNPISAILSRAKLLQRVVPAEQQREWVGEHAEGIRRSGTRMSQLIDEILEAERAAAGHVELKLHSWAIVPLLQDAVDAFHSTSEAQGLRFEINVPGETLYAHCDAGRVQRILSNLIGNAIKFTPKGGTISLSAAAAGKRVKLCVSDTGPGVPLEDQPHLFERYWRGRSGGTGLGLYIAKSLVDAHGGEIWVESNAGLGSSFCFTLPAPTFPA
jgi:signal transduction histidine kinase/integral membrane sensor domain MASE1